MSDTGASAVGLNLAQIRRDLRRNLATLEATQRLVEASLSTFMHAEREVRRIGLREASLLAEHGPEEVAHIGRLQLEANNTFRHLQQQFAELSQQIENTKAHIAAVEAQIPTG